MLAAILFAGYKRCISPVLHAVSAVTGLLGACRFQPTCSEYALIAISNRGIVRGSLLGIWRLLRCNPWGAGGFDPVPGTYVASSVDADAAAGRQQNATGKEAHSCTVRLRQLP